MFCVNCGKKIPENSHFCVSCGAPAPEDDPALRAPAPKAEPAADPELEWAMSMPEEPAPRPDPVRRPIPRKRRKKKRAPVTVLIIILAVLLLAAAATGILALLNRPADPITLSEHMGDMEWSFANIKQLKKGETVLKAQTDDDAAAMEVWEAIEDLPVVPIEDSWAEQTLTDRGIYLNMAGGDDLLDLHVAKDGALRIRWRKPEGGETLCCQDAAAVYEALEDFLPEEDTISLERVIPDVGWTCLSILHADAEDELIHSTFLVEPWQIAECVYSLRDRSPAIEGEGYHLDDLERVSLYLTMEGGVGDVCIDILSDGRGDIPVGVWEYGICDESLYRLALELMYAFG